jgi:predicted DNA-binding protein
MTESAPDRKPSELTTVSVRLSDGDLMVLDALCTKLSTTKSEMIRRAIHGYAGQVAKVLERPSP